MYEGKKHTIVEEYYDANSDDHNTFVKIDGVFTMLHSEQETNLKEKGTEKTFVKDATSEFTDTEFKAEIDAKYFIECCGTNLKDIINELRKLIEYAGENGTITKQDIDILTTKQIDSVIFDLTDNLGKKNIKKAMEVFYNLVYQKEPVQKILITLYNHFKKLYIVKIAQQYNEDIIQALKLKPNQTFLVSKYKTQAGYFEKNELSKILQEFSDLDCNYKKGLIDLNIGIESILCNYV